MSAPQWLRDLRAKAEAATPGPWTDDIAIGDVERGVPRVSQCGESESLVATLADSRRRGPCDAEFIANANPETVLWLLHQLEIAMAFVNEHPPDRRWRMDMERWFAAGPGQGATE